MRSRCPLCFYEESYTFAVVEDKEYWRCSNCRLVYLSPAHRLDRAEEKARYELHENDPRDPGYRRFLRRLTDRLVLRLPSSAVGLDYGCGPAPALPLILEANGFETNIYDPFFASDRNALLQRYDFITCTETAEHFYRPACEFYRFDHLLKMGGWIGIMTRMLERLEAVDAGFEEWHYRRDETHVCFYSRATMLWIARRYGWTCAFPRDDIILFYKPRLLAN